MAEENDKTGRDEALNEDASTPETADDATDETPVAEAPAKAGKFDRLTQEEGGVRKLTGMYKNWFLDYASYVILERAVPHVEDGLKPVQRRILHAMKVVDDGRYNKVANLVGQTMQYHPHGDASIKDALVRQAASPVRWVETIEKMAGMGITHIVECGPGKVLAGLCKRINNSLTGEAIVDQASLDKVLEALK